MASSDRRNFLKATVIGAAGLAARPLLAAQTPNGAAAAKAGPRLDAKDANRISILSYSFLGLFRAGEMDVFGYLESCRYRYGLEAANIWNGMLTSTDKSYLKKVREALDERGLKLCVLTTDNTHVWDPDPAVRAKNRENALAHLNAARNLGAEFMRLDAGGPASGDPRQRPRKNGPARRSTASSRLCGTAKYAADHGFQMGPENHWGPEGVWPNMQKLYTAVGTHPGFGLSVHMSQWQGTREEKDLADRVGAVGRRRPHGQQHLQRAPRREDAAAPRCRLQGLVRRREPQQRPERIRADRYPG